MGDWTVLPLAFGAFAALSGLWGGIALYLLWRDRGGHPKDARPVGVTGALRATLIDPRDPSSQSTATPVSCPPTLMH
jgi:hypothetical protein